MRYLEKCFRAASLAARSVFRFTLQFEHFLAFRNVVPINKIQQLKVIREWAEKPNRVVELAVTPSAYSNRVFYISFIFFLLTNKNVVPRLCVRRHC